MIRFTSCRRLFLAFLVISGCLAAGNGTARGQEWAKKMFSGLSHDFGLVAKGTMPEYVFEIENCYEEDMTISYVRSSCGCTKVELDKQVLKTWEKAKLTARFDGVSFSGSREATVSIGFAHPYTAEVKLSIRGKILSDVQVYPNRIDFGTSTPGNEPVATITVTRLNNPDFQLTDVKSTFPHIAVSIEPAGRNYNSVSYRLKAWLKDTVPAGFVQGELNLIAKDGRGTPQELRIPVQFNGKVVAPLEINPSVWTITNVVPGQVLTKRVILQASQPFRLKDVTCENKSFTVKADDQPRPRHFIEIRYEAPPDVTDGVAELKFETDFAIQPVVFLKATIATAASAAKKEEAGSQPPAGPGAAAVPPADGSATGANAPSVGGKTGAE